MATTDHATNVNRIDAAFDQTEGTALIPFLTVGDPDIGTTVDIIAALEEAGADIVELGVPYSDPLADGPVIQRSSERALKSRITILDCMKVASTCRERGIELPFILFTYYNPVLQIGLDRFFELAAAHDISGLIIPDLPVEENEALKQHAVRYGIHLVPLVAPTSNDRIARIASEASGFVYCVSSLGVTGTRSDFFAGINDFLQTVKSATKVPIAIGFGISNREQVLRFAEICDGVVVGSAIVRKIEDTLPLLSSEATRGEGLLQIRDFVRELKA